MWFSCGVGALMIVCLCEAVSDREIKGCIAKGCRSLGEVRRTCGAGRGCGACHAMVREMIDTAPSLSESVGGGGVSLVQEPHQA